MLKLLITIFTLLFISCSNKDDGLCGPEWSKDTKYEEGNIVKYSNYCWLAVRKNINISPNSDSNYINAAWIAYLGEDY